MHSPLLQELRMSTEQIRKDILSHSLYSTIQDIEDVQLFMQYHVYAVWDFMSLLKSLQNKLTCTSVPWFPVGDAETRYLINEIVVGEEADVDPDGMRKSHFELYLDAMRQCGADIRPIETFIRSLQEGKNLEEAFCLANTPVAAREFVRGTFDVIAKGDAHLLAAVFTFGREDLIPGMFLEMVRDLQLRIPERISLFRYYLERHIEIDGDHHSHLAIRMTSQLCGDNEKKWDEAREEVLLSLRRRYALWQGAYESIQCKVA